MIVFSEIKRCQHPHFTQIFQKAKKGPPAAERVWIDVRILNQYLPDFRHQLNLETFEIKLLFSRQFLKILQRMSIGRNIGSIAVLAAIRDQYEP